MAGNGMRCMWGMMMVVALVAVGWSEAQSPIVGGCVAGLTACHSPLHNSTEPPKPTCCIPLKDAIQNQKKCLCDLFNSPDLLKTFNVTSDQIFSLAARCNISDASPSMCSSTGSSPAPAGTPPPPPGTKNTNAANVAAWSGISFVIALMATFLMF